jgi:thymidylate synthase (FAD)
LARFCLPNATYTDFYFTMDLNNLLKFLGLRNDPAHAQSETVLYAQAMETLITPLIPNVMTTFLRWNRHALTLSSDEVEAVTNGTRQLKTKSVGLRQEFTQKLDRLGLEPKVPVSTTDISADNMLRSLGYAKNYKGTWDQVGCSCLN